MTKDNNIRFIRKNGRIIPIKMNDNQKKGAKMVAAGLGLGAAGGYVAGVKLRSAEAMSQQTFDFMEDKPFSKLPKGAMDIHDGFMKARTKLKLVKKVAWGTRLASSALAFAGIHKILKNKDDSEAKEMAKIGAAAVASEGVTRGIYAGFKRRNPFSLPVAPAVKEGAKGAMKSGAMEVFTRLLSKGAKAAL